MTLAACTQRRCSRRTTCMRYLCLRPADDWQPRITVEQAGKLCRSYAPVGTWKMRSVVEVDVAVDAHELRAERAT